MLGREKRGPPVRGPLRLGRAIKVFAHEGVEAEETSEKEEEKIERKEEGENHTAIR